jgi:hypothetical protein
MDDKARCPRCNTTRLHVLKRLDGIDPVYGNRIANEIRARRGDTIYHCIYCRLQFFDPRKPRPRKNTSGDGKREPPASSSPNPAATRN